MAKRYQGVKDLRSARLYHYEPFCSDWLETTLRSRKIFCGSPATFNDPWDCKPWFKPNAPLMYSCGFSAAVQEQIAKRGVYCLSPDPLSSLMWSHYAANHKGICLEFHVGNPLFLKAQPVNYELEYPTVDSDELLTEETVEKAVLTKDRCWCYEDEFRLIGSPYLPEDNPLRLHDGYLRLPASTLLSIIVGGNGDYDRVSLIAKKHSPELRIIRILRAPNQYKLMMAVPSHAL